MNSLNEPSLEGETLTLCQIIEESFKNDPKILGAVKRLKGKATIWNRTNNSPSGTHT